MAVQPPIQEITANETGRFPQVWIRWFQSLAREINDISAGGEVNTASNLGGGEGVYAAKSSSDLRFKSLTAGSNITLTASATEIEIASSAGGGGTWGSVTGTLSDQTDLQSELDDKLGETFETVNKNLKSWDYSLNYTGVDLTSIVYTSGADTITKTLNYTGSDLTSIVLSGDTPSVIDLTKTLSYTGTDLTGVAYS